MPPHTTVDTDESCDKSVRIFERVQFIWHFSGRRLISASGCIAVVWSDVIKLFGEVIELSLLCAVVTAGGFSRFILECFMHALVLTILLRTSGLNQDGITLNLTHQADSRESRPRGLVANGTPLSVRICLGNPYSLNTRVNTGMASSTLVLYRPWRARIKREYSSMMVNG